MSGSKCAYVTALVVLLAASGHAVCSSTDTDATERDPSACLSLFKEGRYADYVRCIRASLAHAGQGPWQYRNSVLRATLTYRMVLAAGAAGHPAEAQEIADAYLKATPHGWIAAQFRFENDVLRRFSDVAHQEGLRWYFATKCRIWAGNANEQPADGEAPAGLPASNRDELGFLAEMNLRVARDLRIAQHAGGVSSPPAPPLDSGGFEALSKEWAALAARAPSKFCLGYALAAQAEVYRNLLRSAEEAWTPHILEALRDTVLCAQDKEVPAVFIARIMETRGIALYNTDPTEAAAMFRQAVESSPDDAEVRALHVGVVLYQRRFDDALRMLRELEAFAPKSPHTWDQYVHLASLVSQYDPILAARSRMRVVIKYPDSSRAKMAQEQLQRQAIHPVLGPLHGTGGSWADALELTMGESPEALPSADRPRETVAEPCGRSWLAFTLLIVGGCMAFGIALLVRRQSAWHRILLVLSVCQILGAGVTILMSRRDMERPGESAAPPTKVSQRPASQTGELVGAATPSCFSEEAKTLSYKEMELRLFARLYDTSEAPLSTAQKKAAQSALLFWTDPSAYAERMEILFAQEGPFACAEQLWPVSAYPDHAGPELIMLLCRCKIWKGDYAAIPELLEGRPVEELSSEQLIHVACLLAYALIKLERFDEADALLASAAREAGPTRVPTFYSSLKRYVKKLRERTNTIPLEKRQL